MNLNRHARDHMVLAIATDPPVTGPWEATFDDGATWHDGEAVPGHADRTRWLIAGPDAEQGGAVAQLAVGIHPVTVRCVDSTEIVADHATHVHVN